jgi:hypothetical protein
MSRIRRTTLVLSLCCIASAAAADRNRIVNEGGIRDQWMLADGVALAVPGYPAEFKERADNVCVAIGYSIDPRTGNTGDFILLKQWSSAGAEPEKGYFDAYAASAAGALAQWKFKPRPEVSKPQRTITVATMTFTGKEKMDPAMLRANCAVSDLATAIQSANNDNLKNRNRLRRDMEQTLRNANAAQSLINNPVQSATPRP